MYFTGRLPSHHIKTGLSSGEGLVFHVRDPQEEQQPVRERGRVAGYQRVIVDEGEPDKRLLIVEPELAVVLRRMSRGGSSSLSGVIRHAWDTGNLSTLTRRSPLRATGAHVSIIGHITEPEVRRYLTETERANGFANRFLWLYVDRSKLLPEGATVPDAVLAPLIEELRRAVDVARTIGEVRRDAAARALWAEVYPKLSTGAPEMIGAILSRAEAQVLRLSVLYAVLDGSEWVRPTHLKAALALWDYAEASARRIFCGQPGRPVADVIAESLRTRGPLSQTQIHRLFSRHRTSQEIETALATLQAGGHIHRQQRQTGGRPETVWTAT